MKTIYSTLVMLLLSICCFSQSKSMLGFSEANAASEEKIEAQFQQNLQAGNLDKWMKQLTAQPHNLGSDYGKKNAEYIRDLFKSWGYDANIEVYKVLFPTPKVRLLEMTAPSIYKAKLAEPVLKEDLTTGQSTQLPIYNAWSADGDVTAEVVFVNYGVPKDYEQLERLGIDVKGKIVIAKYGGSWRGIKPKVAQEHGAVGCLIYSDPADDGYAQGDVYPKGPFRPKFGAQRGSVMDMPIYPGDPLTPNVGATENAKRLNRKDVENLISIPVQPISYGDALPILEALGGQVAPNQWNGGLPITYHVGPGPSKVHLKLEFNWDMVNCYDVIAKMKGSEFPDEWVIRGNHHDAWNSGAEDPISGMVAELEEARAIGELAKTGWKPKRTIIYCAWDGEEPGLIGSTEWVEHHENELQKNAVAYINSDGNGRGFLFAQGSHTLETLVNEVGNDVTDPQTGVSIIERKKSQSASTAKSIKEKKEILSKQSINIDALGSGSDYSPFIQHLAVPSLNIGFSGESEAGIYHSIYDSYHHYTSFMDPKFAYGILLANTAGRTTLRLANADLLPFDFTTFHKTVSVYLDEVKTLISNMREETKVENQMIQEKRYVLSADPTKKYVDAKEKDQVPFINFSSLENAVMKLEQTSSQFAKVVKATTPNVSELNKRIYQIEQKLLSPTGLPRRPWYRHTLYAPGFYTGYGVKTLPGIREALEQRQWVEAQQQIEIVAKAISDYSSEIEAIISSVKK